MPTIGPLELAAVALVITALAAALIVSWAKR